MPKEIFGAEPDTCWLYSGGVDPVSYLKKYNDRSPVIHLKDCVKEGGRNGYKPVGDGVLDFKAILAQCRQAEWICVEQDEPNDGLTDYESAKRSVDNLKKLLG